MEVIRKLLLENKAWVQSKLEIDQDFFQKIAKGQEPHFFWIGCCDSRVHPAELVNVSSGEMFVHTNIANQANTKDTNMMSALEYSVKILKVNYIIVCGHSQCGGIKASLDNNIAGPIGEWIHNIKKLRFDNPELFPHDLPREQQEQTLTELNIQAQCENLANTEVVRSERLLRKVQIHGWLYEMEKGTIKEICIT